MVTVLGFLGHAVSATTLLWQPGSSHEHAWAWLCSSNTSQQQVLGLIQSMGFHLPAPDLGGPQASRASEALYKLPAEVNLRDISSLLPDHDSKLSLTTKQVIIFFLVEGLAFNL